MNSSFLVKSYLSINRYIRITALFLMLLFMTRGPVYSQDERLIEFSYASRFDFIGLSTTERRNYGLIHGEADISASVLTDNLKLFKGGEFFIQAMSIFGGKASEKYSGDLQVFSNIESDTRLFLYQAYYKHTFNKLIVKLGQLDLNADYSVSGYGSSLINSSFGVIPTISMNMPVSIFAYLSAGVSVKYLLSNRLTLQMAFFDGDPGNYESNRYNLNWNLSKDEGYFNISEIHYKTKSNLKQGKYKAGIFYHSQNTEGPSEITSHKIKPGVFIMGDQQITYEKNTIKNGLSAFFQISISPSSVNMVGSYYALGLIYRGIFSRMNEDECTLAVASARIGNEFLIHNPEYLHHETVIEFTYKKFITPNIIIQPDIQYIFNTGSVQPGGNCTVGLIRTAFLF